MAAAGFPGGFNNSARRFGVRFAAVLGKIRRGSPLSSADHACASWPPAVVPEVVAKWPTEGGYDKPLLLNAAVGGVKMLINSSAARDK